MAERDRAGLSEAAGGWSGRQWSNSRHVGGAGLRQQLYSAVLSDEAAIAGQSGARERLVRDLLQRYLDRWVAVYGQEVVGVAGDPERLVAQLKKKGIPPDQVYWERLSTDEDLLVLAAPHS